jgi:hypothetical protein
VTGQYFYHQRPRAVHPAAASPMVQDQLLAACAELTGVRLTGPALTDAALPGAEPPGAGLPEEFRS